MGVYVEALTIAGTVAAIVSLPDVLSGLLPQTHVAIGLTKGRVGEGEIGVELDGMLEEWDSFHLFATNVQVPGSGVRFQRFERGSGGLLDGGVILLDSGKGFAQGFAHPGSS